MRFRLLIIGLAIVAIVSLLYYVQYYAQSPRTHIIIRTESGFKPRDITVRQGDTVQFIAEHGATYWPASDAHPSHAFYRDFDPRRALLPEETWSFVMDRPGLWPYHDHLHPGLRGTITVAGRMPSLEECISFYGTSTSQSFCWGQTLMQVVRDKGVEAAFAAIEPMRSSPQFEQQCHDVMHIFGQAAYADFAKDPARVQAHPLTAACGYGFYHGFIETMLVDTGRGDSHMAREYCENLMHASSLGSESARKRALDACYHGVGHAFFDTVDSSLWGDPRRMLDSVTRQCEALIMDPVKQEICMSGVYNSLANALANKDYFLAFDAGSDRICAEELFAYQNRCYIEVSTGLVRNLKFGFEASVAHIRSLPAHGRWLALRAFIDGELRHRTVGLTPAKATALCAYFTDDDERLDCLSGALRAFFYMSPSGGGDDLAQELFAVCAGEGVPGLRADCARKARAHLSAQMTHERSLALCEASFPTSDCTGPAGEM